LSDHNGKPKDAAKLITANNVSEELAADLNNVLIFMGARYTPDSGKQHIEIVLQRDLLATLDMGQKAQLVEALQKAAEYIAATMAGSSGASIQ
jgi:hypothetical protein